MSKFTVRVSRRQFASKSVRKMLKRMLKSGGGVRVIFVASLLMACSLLGACSSGPTSPSAPSCPVGSVCTVEKSPVYLCLTQPRAYSLPNGEVSWEIDSYESYDPCPVVPIA